MGEPILVYDYVGVDTETTGLDSDENEIVEITAIEFNRSGLTGKMISKRCRPISGNIPAVVSAIHGITYEMVKDCPAYLRDGVVNEIASFFGNRTVVGHNVKKFDLGFIKVIPHFVLDTLEMCRKTSRTGNKLKSACLRNNIEWDDKLAHGSEYDTRKCIQLFCKLMDLEDKVKMTKEDPPLFAMPNNLQANGMINADVSDAAKTSIIPSDNDKRMLATQAYSFSRLNLFNQCHFKWYMQYIKKIKEPDDKDYFQVGKICHKVAEWTGEWCYKKQFKNKLEVYMGIIKMTISNDTKRDLSVLYKKPESEIGIVEFAEYIGHNPLMVKKFFPSFSGLGSLIYDMDAVLPVNSYEFVSMPDPEAYEVIIEKAINYYRCDSPDIITDCRRIMSRFYNRKDFSLTPGDLTLTEKKLVFDKDWNSLNDFFSNKAFFRGIIDVLSYFKDYIVITDYKTSRKMMTVEQLKEDRQTMAYVLMAYKFMPKDSFKKVVVRIEYIRFGETVEYEIDNPKEVADRALQWINDVIQNIEKEMLKTDGSAFKPIRNEYCHTCYLGEDGLCPLFNKLISGKLDNPFTATVSDTDECHAAWKRIETNKAEIAHLTKLCKSFVTKCDGEVRIDGNAILDFHASKYREYDIYKTFMFFLGEKKMDMKDLIRYVSITPSDVMKLIKHKSINVTVGELNSISTEKIKTTFDAFTSEEAKNKGFINT